MRCPVSLLLLLLCHAAAPAQVRDLATQRGAPERKAILEALRGPVAKETGQPVSFVVEVLKTDGNWAFFRGATKTAAGGAIDWAHVPAYAEAVREGLFDGAGTAALLHKESGQWRCRTHVIGPTDVAWACWWKEFGAPKALFDYAESGCR